MNPSLSSERNAASLHDALLRRGKAEGFTVEHAPEGILWKRNGEPRVLFRWDGSSQAFSSEVSVPLIVRVGETNWRLTGPAEDAPEPQPPFHSNEFTLPASVVLGEEESASETGLLAHDERLRVVEAHQFPSPAGDQSIQVFHAPRLARALRPGQFLNVAVSDAPFSPRYRVVDEESRVGDDTSLRPELRHLARVPLSMLRVYREGSRLPSGAGPLPSDFAYHLRPAGADRVSVAVRVVGAGTRSVYEAEAGDERRVLGPLGLPERVSDGVRRVVLLAGGVGFAPLYALAEQCHWRGIPTTFLAGARVRSHLFPFADDPNRYVAPEFHDLDLELRAVSEEEHGKFATDLLLEHLQSAEGRDTDLVYVCGPWPMMARAAAVCASEGVACRVFLEKRMECGIGVCMSCVCRYQRETGEWANVRVCREGTVFDAARIKW